MATFRLVEETLVREDDPTVNCPVEVEKVIRLEEEAEPPTIPNKTWVSTPLENPPQPVQEVTVKVPMVELGLLSSVVEATPNQFTENLVAEAV